MIMKKYFIFSAIAAAGLLTSCSSSDDAISEGPGNPIGNQEEPQKIILGATANANVTTRGTGTVGDIAGENTNVWGGEHVNVYMFNKGSFYLAGAFEAVKDANNQVTYQPVTNGAALYDNTEMRTPNPGEYDGAEVAELVDGTAAGDKLQQHKYYPMVGNFDFWAYHVDDAGTGTGNVGVPAFVKDDGTDADTPDEAVAVQVPFTINGTQDLMVASAWPTVAELGTTVGTAGDFYSAKAARANIQPNLTFQHLLTRLKFFIKGGDLASCGWTYDETDPNNPTWVAPAANAVYGGVFVKGIKVYSRQSGKIVAAYDYWTGAAAPAPTKEVKDLISWDYTGTYADGYNAYKTAQANAATLPTDVVPFDLMGKKDPLASIASGAGTPAQYGWVSSNVTDYGNATTTKTDVATTATSIEDAIAAYATAADENNVGQFVRFYTEDATPGYDGTEDIIGYAVSSQTAAAVPGGTTSTPGAAGAAAKLPALYDADVFIDENAWKEALTNDDNDNYSKIYKATATAADNIDKVQVGSPMLVSTEESGYYMEITLAQYLLDKSQPAASYVEPGETAEDATTYKLQETTLTRLIPAPTNAGKFEQKTSYDIVITTYGYKEISIKATLTGWIDGEDVDVTLE